MEKMNDNNIVLINFTGVYKDQQFYKGQEVSWVEVQELSGCNCYCDGDAMESLEELISEFSAEGIHFLDSGNYHYMSLLWLKKLQQPFWLLVFDNHTDMQPPAFGGLLSCGGWIAAALEELPLLERLVLVGPDQEAYEQTDPLLRKKVQFLSREKLATMSEEEKREFFCGFSQEFPFYISVDKDILCPEDASTDWSQGDLRIGELELFLRLVFSRQKVIGMDVCGECDFSGDGFLNERANGLLLNIWREWRNSHEK